MTWRWRGQRQLRMVPRPDLAFKGTPEERAIFVRESAERLRRSSSMAERRPLNSGVVGSNPTGGTARYDRALGIAPFLESVRYWRGISERQDIWDAIQRDVSRRSVTVADLPPFIQRRLATRGGTK